MKRSVRISAAAIIAFIFLIISYWVTNLSFPISGEKALLTEWEFMLHKVWPKDTEMTDSVLLVNVSFDKELIPAYDDKGMPLGMKEITNRRKLLMLLNHLKEQDKYKYILLDVLFDDTVKTKYDSLLFNTIASMPRIVIPCHTDIQLADSILMAKAAMADYRTTHSESDFVRYAYLPDGRKSIPVRMYEDLTGRSILNHGIIFSDGLRLARSSMVLTFDLIANDWYDQKGNRIWYNLGADLLNDSIVETGESGSGLLYEVPELTNGKYIIIGAFQGDDTHNTFMGDMAGVVINFNAFTSLVKGRHIVSLWLVLILFVSFFIMAYLALGRKSLPSWLSYTMFMTALCFITYWLLGEVYDILFTATMFWLLGYVLKLYDYCKIHSIWRKRK